MLRPSNLTIQSTTINVHRLLEDLTGTQQIARDLVLQETRCGHHLCFSTQVTQ
ncbi:hypothetical protein AM1_0458 [Acaryochloris marina MBIC11017]|uniref:Uncharacterized protein n=1 Tax=Acaryochloris marina (strain MBIC 11017) TaxID=329726 RepID=B0CB24_ACAM1|nr:hypothetical protein AM1_0458 [Acaryochloris marina MBIC11017]